MQPLLSSLNSLGELGINDEFNLAALETRNMAKRVRKQLFSQMMQHVNCMFRIQIMRRQHENDRIL